MSEAKYELKVLGEKRVALARTMDAFRSASYVSDHMRDVADSARRAWEMALEQALMVCEDDVESSALLMAIAPPSEVVKAAKRIAMGRARSQRVAITA